MLLVFSSVEHQTARTGAVRSGRRQSMPSNSIASCAVVKETLPLVACGQTKRPCSPLAEQAQAIAIPPQQFDPVTAPSPKHEDLAGERIRLKLGLHQGRQAIEPRRMSVAPATIQMRVPMGGAIIATPAARPVARFAGRHASMRKVTRPHSTTSPPGLDGSGIASSAEGVGALLRLTGNKVTWWATGPSCPPDSDGAI